MEPGEEEEEEEEEQNLGLAEYFRQEFRAARMQAGETHVAFLFRLKRLLGRWLEAAQVEVSPSLEDVMVTEQFCQTLAPPTAALVRARKPATLEEMALLVDELAPGREREAGSPAGAAQPSSVPGDARAGAPARAAADSQAAARPASVGRHVRCHQCRRLGHVRRDCPERKGKDARGRKTLPSIN